MDKLTKIFADVFNEHTWHKVKDNTLAFSGLIFGVLVVFVLIAIGKHFLNVNFYFFVHGDFKFSVMFSKKATPKFYHIFDGRTLFKLKA